MNKQAKYKDGVLVGRGIEWTSFTWNPIAGCFHACQWAMPNGEIANCYAEDVAERSQAVVHYPEGFEYHYWHPERLDEPLSVKQPARIFVGSMADVFGHWVPAEQIQAVLDTCRNAYWHQFQFLTKNPVRIKNFNIPPNCWMGASSPPDFMWGKPLSRRQQQALFDRTLRVFEQLNGIRWMSIEPLSFDIVEFFEARDFSNFFDEQQGPLPLNWIVIGAASNGPVYYQPDPHHLRRLIGWADDEGIPLFYKGNLRPSIPNSQWREAFPEIVPIQARLK